jgi:DNA-binding NtrC family response regulator
MARILIVDDEATMLQMVTELLRSDGHDVFPFADGAAALEKMEELNPELVITDLHLENSRVQGLDILKKARSLNPPVEVIVITAFGSIENAVAAMRAGAYDYLEKPFKVDEFKLCAQRALSYNHAVAENQFLKKQLREKYHFTQIIGAAPKMQAVFRMIERVADTDSTVLILGESGTGKELVARALHFNSRRQFAPFIPINCAALPENLLESELFGHRKGAFTGAIADKKGLFQEADGGTIFLDEIGSMPAMLQSRLLRVLQDREVRRVGENTPTYVNVRVLAATNEALEKQIKAGGFREDLYYRLNVIPIELPALRERREDIPLLVAHLLRGKMNPRNGQPFQISRQAMGALSEYSWPGNVRELENLLERACALCDGNLVSLADFPAAVRECAPKEADASVEAAAPLASGTEVAYSLPGGTSAQSQPQPGLPEVVPLRALKDFLREQEVNYLNRALAFAGGNKEKAADLLGVSLATLYRKLAGDGGT